MLLNLKRSVARNGRRTLILTSSQEKRMGVIWARKSSRMGVKARTVYSLAPSPTADNGAGRHLPSYVFGNQGGEGTAFSETHTSHQAGSGKMYFCMIFLHS